MRFPSIRPVVWTAQASLVLLCSSCSLLDPYVRAPELDENSATPTLSGAIAKAEAQRKAYFAAVSTRAKLRNGLPLALVPLGAAALYKGSASEGGESTRKLLLKEGLVSASLFGLGSQFISTTREQTYLAGAKALSCSIYAMTPYLQIGLQAERLTPQKAEALASQIARLDGAKHAVQALRSDSGIETRMRSQLDALLAHADGSIVAARQVLADATTTQAALDDAGARLRAVVESIVTEVNQQISLQEPDPASILLMVDSLAANAKRFAPAAKFSLNPHKELSLGVSEGALQLQEFERQLKALDDERAAQQFALNLIAARAKAVPALESCQVQAVHGQIDISPAEVVQIKVGETRQFVIRSTAGIPSVEWIGPVDPRIGLDRTLAGETLLVKVSYTEAVPGLTELTLQAATKTAKKLITIGLAAAAEPAAPSASAPAPAASAANGASSVKKPAPRAKKEQAAKPPQPPPPPAAAAPSAPVAAAIDPAQAGNEVEARLLENNGARLRQLQAKLGVAQTGVFDPATRSAVRKWKKDKGLPDGDGSIQTPVIQGLLKQ